MTEQEFQTKLAELMGEITTLPQAERKKLEKLASETRERHERLRATVSTLQESLDYLRLSIKYLVFDLEVIFLYPWAVQYDKLGVFGLFEMLVFVAILLIGYFYAWKKGALDWV